MFKKVHLRLTLIFTAVCSLILMIMSALYLYLSYQNTKTNIYQSFQSDIETILTNIEGSTAVSDSWLSKLESDGKYKIYIYDHEIPFTFVKNTKSEQDMKLVTDIREHYFANYQLTGENSYVPYYIEFDYTANSKNYLVGIGIIPRNEGNLELFVIYPQTKFHAQMNRLYLQFASIVFGTIILIWIFSWYFTKRLLKPIEESQIKQAQFISSASHELRTPVATILSALGAMDKGNEEEKKEFSQIAKKEGERLTILVNDMLSLARSDNHTFTITKKVSEPDTLLLDSYEAFLALCHEKNLSLNISLPDSTVLPRKMDPLRIKQVLSILISNAISYTNPGGSIHLSFYETPKDIVFSICDNGIGISDENKPYIFDRFYRADSSRNKKEHFGLGLCIAKEIVDAHKGTITVTDTPGGGSTFLLILPK